MLPCASLAYLDALGIDVWVRRELLDARARVAASHTPETDPAAGVAPVGEVASQPAVAPAGESSQAVGEAVAFTIRCVRFGRVLALIDAPLWQERRFFLDVARAMHGPGHVEPESLRFDWPQLRSADAGMEAARRAFRAYLQTQVAGHTRVLAAGARLRELIGDDLDEYLYLDHALRSPAEKQSLWRRIQGLR
ncbi:MAG: hypothetical protein OXH52_11525 [Gammaproteobacteria bacterium]|nr:hypothetical protein [Gammaproteobacteria bacterium]